MSQENVEIVKRAYEQFAVSGRFVAEVSVADFVWDMSNFHGWPEQQTYEGVAGAEAFLREWLGAWDDWRIEVDTLRDAGDRVLAIVRQRGRSKITGTPVDMCFGQVWTFSGGKRTRMEMYSEPDAAFKAVGLEE